MTTVTDTHRTPAFREEIQIVWGYSTLMGRALDANEDPRLLLEALRRALTRTPRP